MVHGARESVFESTFLLKFIADRQKEHQNVLGDWTRYLFLRILRRNNVIVCNCTLGETIPRSQKGVFIFSCIYCIYYYVDKSCSIHTFHMIPSTFYFNTTLAAVLEVYHLLVDAAVYNADAVSDLEYPLQSLSLNHCNKPLIFKMKSPLTVLSQSMRLRNFLLLWLLVSIFGAPPSHPPWAEEWTQAVALIEELTAYGL